jgi:hypothetical protein
MLVVGTRLNVTNQDSGKTLSPGVIALVGSGAGLASIFLILDFAMDLGVLPLLAFSVWFVIVLYVTIRIIRRMRRLEPDTPEWSKNERRLGVLGATTAGMGYFTSFLLFLGVLMYFSGLVLLIISDFHPKKRIRMTTPIQKEDGAESEI